MEWNNSKRVCFLPSLPHVLYFKGYKGSKYKKSIKDMILECEECQAHITEDDILSQEVHKFKQLKIKQKPKIINYVSGLSHLNILSGDWMVLLYLGRPSLQPCAQLLDRYWGHSPSRQGL